jgi:signal transduction histidine kinase
VVTRVEEWGEARCEAAPESFPRGPVRPPRFVGDAEPPPDLAAPRDPLGSRRFARSEGRRRPVEMFAYDARYHSANPTAPVFPAGLRRTLEEGAESASYRVPAGPETPGWTELAVRTGWTRGACAVILARLPQPPVGPALGVLAPALLVGAGLLVAVWIAAGPVVRRIRALTTEVRLSAAERYARPVAVAGSDEVAALARAFNEAGAEVRSHLTRVEEREETLRSFLANTTHDVMLPLTVLLGHLASMRARLEKGETVQEPQLTAAVEEAQYMASLVHNLGAAAKLEAGEPLLQRHALDLSALVERAVERHQPLARSRKITLDFSVPEAPLRTKGDVTLVEQAVSNVVHNAVRYNDAGGHVAVVLEAPRDTRRFRLRVVDDGPGVPDEQLERLADRSFRTDAARTRHPEGRGLGLHIARSVAERHGFGLAFRRSEYGGLQVDLDGPLLEDGPPGADEA